MQNSAEFRVLFHVKAAPAYGWGHLVRSCRLFTHLRWQADCRFLIEGSDQCERYLKERDAPVLRRFDGETSLTPGDLAAGIAAWRPDVVVVDMLDPLPEILGCYHDLGVRVFLLSDEGRRNAKADLVVCPNPQELWCDPAAGNMIGGLDYVSVPAELSSLRGTVKEQGKTLFVNSGGATTRARFEKMVAVLSLLEQAGLSGLYVVGFATDFELASQAHGLQHFEVLPGVADLRPLLARSDMAFVTTGYIRYELAFIGMPMCLTSIVDHQHRFGLYLAERGCAEYVGPLATTAGEEMAKRVLEFARDETRRSSMRQQAMAVIDGKGDERLCREIRRLALGNRALAGAN